MEGCGFNLINAVNVVRDGCVQGVVFALRAFEFYLNYSFFLHTELAKSS